MRLVRLVRRGLQALFLLFAFAQAAAPLLHAHFSGEHDGVAGVHVHLGMSLPWSADGHPGGELSDFDARILSAPDMYFRDEPLGVFDLPALRRAAFLTPDSALTGSITWIDAVPLAAARPFPKPLPLAPPASA